MSNPTPIPDVNSFLMRNPIAAATIAQTALAGSLLGWDQVINVPSMTSLPNMQWFDTSVGLVPPWGMTIFDTVDGNVLVSWDANGNWHYVSSSLNVNAPIYGSPLSTPPGTPSAPCDPTTGDLSGFLCSIQGYATTALTIVGGWLLYEMIK